MRALRCEEPPHGRFARVGFFVVNPVSHDRHAHCLIGAEQAGSGRSSPEPGSGIGCYYHRSIATSASIRCMPTMRTTFTLDESLAEQARRLGISISAAAREGVALAVRAALAQADREAYQHKPEQVDEFWADAETWGDE